MNERGRAEQRAFENLEYIGVNTDDADRLLRLLAEAPDADLEFLAQCTLEEFLLFAERESVE